MKDLRYRNVFDTIGPVMIGPSSSHATEAARIGRIVRSILGEQLDSVNIYPYESFTKTCRGHGTDVVLAGSLLGMEPDDERLADSLKLAYEAGVEVLFVPKSEKAERPNSVKMLLEKGTRKLSVASISIGGGNIRTSELNGLEISSSTGTPTLIVVRQDAPGMIAKMTSIPPETSTNIGAMAVTRGSKGENAIMITEVDDPQVEETVKRLKQLPNTNNINYSDQEAKRMFLSTKELVDQAKTYPSVARLMIVVEMEMGGRSRSHTVETMERNLSVMEQSISGGKGGVTSVTGTTGDDAKKLDDYLNEADFLSGETILKVVRNAVAVNKVNAKMGLTRATPTTEGTDVVPGALMTVRDRLDLAHERQLESLFTADTLRLVIANNASISGARGGCQVGVDSASATAAATLVCAKNGTPHQTAQAVAITLKNMMGLIRDPVAGLVEVPCVKCNALGSSQVFISADMALADIESIIPSDEVVVTMHQVGRQMPSIFKKTAEGGLAVTPAARRLAEEILNKRV